MMGMYVRSALLLLLMGHYCLAQPTSGPDDYIRFERRMATLAPVQRFRPTLLYTNALMEQSRFAEARHLLQAALATARQKQLTPWVGRFLMELGNTETPAGNHTLAIDYYLQALAIFQTTHAYDQQQRACYFIRAEYNTLENAVKSQEYEQKAKQLAREHQTANTAFMPYSSEADNASQRGDQELSVRYMRKSMAVLRANRSWTTFHSFLDFYGLSLARAGRYREAEQIFYRCLAYSRRQGDRRREMYEYMHLPEPLLHLGRLDEAQRFAKLALNRIDHDPERQDEHRVDVYDLLARIAEAKGQYPQALAYERLRSQYAGRVQSTEKNRQVAEVETRFQTVQKQARIDRLDTDNQRQLSQISWQAGGLVALLALLGLAGWQYRVIRRVNARLHTTNQTIWENNRQIREQADRLSVLMRELHHRVKNNLAIVSSLLRMQSRRLDDPQAVQAVQDGQRRVEAIALIHQQFYQTENLASVSIKAYVTELTEGLLLGYGFDPETFDCRVEVADIQVNVEVAVPLGLILNEVLTNAFKYAYTAMDTRDQSPLAAAPSIRPSLVVRLQSRPGEGLLVEVQDNGPGLSVSSPSKAPTGRRQSFGQRLMRELSEQLGGEMSLTNRQGTYFRLWLPDPA